MTRQKSFTTATKICIIAGEASGDLYGAKLIQELRQTNPNLEFFGVGGTCMKELAFESILPIERFQIMGFSDVVRSFFTIVSNFFTVKREILSRNPDVVIFIDQPDFSLRMAKAARKKGFTGKIVQFVAPTVWAYKKNRILTLEKYFDLLLTLFPFENEYFAKSSLKTICVGHPIVEDITQDPKHSSKILALFPGSRPSEIKRNFPVQIDAAIQFCKQAHDMELAISVSTKELLPWMLNLVELAAKNNGFCPRVSFVPYELRYDLMKKASLALAKSGTVTLELALHKVPTVVTYALSSLNYFIAKYVLRLKLEHFCIVNIIKKRELFPELIKTKVTPTIISQKLFELYSDKNMYAQIQNDCSELFSILQKDKKPSQIAQEAIQELLNAKN